MARTLRLTQPVCALPSVHRSATQQTSQHNCRDLYLSSSGRLGPPPALHRSVEAVSWGVSNIIVSPGRCGGIPTEFTSGGGGWFNVDIKVVSVLLQGTAAFCKQLSLLSFTYLFWSAPTCQCLLTLKKKTRKRLFSIIRAAQCTSWINQRQAGWYSGKCQIIGKNGAEKIPKANFIFGKTCTLSNH